MDAQRFLAESEHIADAPGVLGSYGGLCFIWQCPENYRCCCNGYE